MTHLFQTFYAKLSALLLGLILVLGVAITGLSVRAGMRLADEAEQALNHRLAENLAREFEPDLVEHIDHERIRQKIAYMMLVNPRIEIYLLEPDGTIKASFLGPEARLEQTRVDLDPLRRYLAGAEGPILGSDPRKAGRRKPFSAANIVITGDQNCFLYIILGSEQYDSAASMVRESYIMRATLRGLGLTLAAALVVGLVLFRLLTRRLRRMNEVVRAFEAGHHDARVPVASADEIGQLGASFNRMADSIVASLADLRRTDRLRRELIANVSHDLRSPLASIQGYLETVLMKHGTLEAEAQRRYLEVALKNTRSLNTLVAQLFELSKLDAEQVQPHREPFALAELAQDVVMQFTPQAQRRNVRLEAELPPGLPPVEADLALVERAFSNLLDNALRHTPPGGHVRLVLAAGEGAVQVRVEDTGAGIPPEELPHIFDRFYRVEKSRARHSGGTGLGLAITKKILDLHESELIVESTVEAGTTFTFELPVASPVAAGAC